MQADALLLDPNQCSPGSHSLVYLFLLAAKGAAVKAPDESFLHLATQFCLSCDPEQVAREPERVSKVCKALADNLTAMASVGAAMGAVRPLGLLLQKMTDAAKVPHMTVVHRPYVMVCMLAKCYKEALSILGRQIIDLPTNRAGLEPYDIVVYAYYGGMIYIGMKQYENALKYFNIAFTASTHGPTSCLVEAFKKYLIVSLMVHGKLEALPKWSTRMQTQLQLHTPQYVELKDAFESNDAEKLAAKMAEHNEVFTKDNNMGLVKQTLAAMKRQRVKKLTLTYLTLSLADIAEKTGLESQQVAEATVLDMVWDSPARVLSQCFLSGHVLFISSW